MKFCLICPKIIVSNKKYIEANVNIIGSESSYGLWILLEQKRIQGGIEEDFEGEKLFHLFLIKNLML